MLDKIKSEIYMNLESLFTEAAVHDMTGDTTAYKAALKKIAAVAEALGIKTEIVQVKLNLSSGEVRTELEQ